MQIDMWHDKRFRMCFLSRFSKVQKQISANTSLVVIIIIIIISIIFYYYFYYGK